jgi:hypothetical protein
VEDGDYTVEADAGGGDRAIGLVGHGLNGLV